MKFSTAPDVELEIDSAIQWYEMRRVGLGLEFIAAIEQAFERIRQMPLFFPRSLWGASRYNLRYCVVRNFPYTVVYQCNEAEIIIVAISHMSRLPNYWHKRLH
ncbi:MAG: type II toxin-antitoxin system RelE/ParE family toxin [Alphaproteobacteria bacterium]|nr:type II toxin-antitoxin system RelE/ParE family toxin [Alphaproteobacteria bacterium]